MEQVSFLQFTVQKKKKEVCLTMKLYGLFDFRSKRSIVFVFFNYYIRQFFDSDFLKAVRYIELIMQQLYSRIQILI